MLISCGCEEQMQQPGQSGYPAVEVQKTCLFAPAKIKFNQLTEVKDSGQIIAYIDMLDEFGSRIKDSGVWRFELYEYVPRSTESRGARVYIWPEITLIDAKVNYNLWQDYLRCYKFDLNLDIDIVGDKSYILQAVCFTAQGKRLSDWITLKM